MVRGVTSDLQTRRVALIHKRLAAIQRNEPLSQRMYFARYEIAHYLTTHIITHDSDSIVAGRFSANA